MMSPVLQVHETISIHNIFIYLLSLFSKIITANHGWFMVCIYCASKKQNAYMHVISTQLVYHQCLMCSFEVNASTPLKMEKLQGTFNAVQTSKCMFPPFLQHALK